MDHRRRRGGSVLPLHHQVVDKAHKFRDSEKEELPDILLRYEGFGGVHLFNLGVTSNPILVHISVLPEEIPDDTELLRLAA